MKRSKQSEGDLGLEDRTACPFWSVIKIYCWNSIKRQVHAGGLAAWSVFTWPEKEAGPSSSLQIFVCSGKCLPSPREGFRSTGSWPGTRGCPSFASPIHNANALSSLWKIWKREWKILNVLIWATGTRRRRPKWIDKDAVRNMRRQSQVQDVMGHVGSGRRVSWNRVTYLGCESHYHDKQIKEGIKNASIEETFVRSLLFDFFAGLGCSETLGRSVVKDQI